MGIFAHAIRLPRHAARILRFNQVLLWKRSFHSKKARQQKGADAPKCSELTRHLIRQAACKVSLKLYDPLRYGVLSSDDRYSRCVYSITRSRRMEVLWENFTVCSQSTLPCRHGESFAGLEQDRALPRRLGICSLPAYGIRHRDKALFLRSFAPDEFSAASREFSY